MKSKDLQPRLLYAAKLSFRIARHKQCFPDKVKLKEFIITKRDLFKKNKMIKTMNNKMTTNSQLSTTESKKEKQTKQTTRAGIES